MPYGEALRRILEKSDIEPAELARRIGRSRSYISQLMSGKIGEPSLSAAYAIADALGLTVQDFLDLMNS